MRVLEVPDDLVTFCDWQRDRATSPSAPGWFKAFIDHSVGLIDGATAALNVTVLRAAAYEVTTHTFTLALPPDSAEQWS